MLKAICATRCGDGGGKYFEPLRIYMALVDGYEPTKMTNSIDYIRTTENKRATRRVRLTKANLERLCEFVNAGKIDFTAAKKIFNDSYLASMDVEKAVASIASH